MEESGGQEEQGHFARGDDDVIHSRIGGRSQAADQKEHEQAGHGEEDPCGRHAGLPENDEHANPEEKESEQRRVEVAGVADAPPAKLDVDLENASARSHQVRHRVADIVLIEQFLGMGLGIFQELSIDADDHVRGSDARPIGAGARNHCTHDTRTGNVRLQDHAIVGMRKKHVRNREGGNQECENPGRQRQRQTPL